MVRRSATNTPLQAFVLLHDPQFVESARQLAIRVLRRPDLKNDRERLTFACLATIGRQPEPEETRILLALLEKRRVEYQLDPEEVAGLLSVGASATPEEIGDAEVASWMIISRLLMNLSETITRG